MVTLRTIDTRVFILAALAIAIVALGLGTWFKVSDDSARQARIIELNLRGTLDVVTPTLAQYVRVSDIQSVQAAMMVLEAGPNIDMAATVARDGRILAANQVDLVGLPAARLPWAGSVIDHGRPPTEVEVRTGTDQSLLLLYPLAPVADEAVDPSLPRPYVVIAHDRARSSALIRNAAWHYAMISAAIAALIASALIFVYARYISQPARKLAGLVREMGATGTAAPIEMRGIGDLAELGIAFARAGDRLAERQDALARMNEELAARREYLEVTLRSIGDGVIVTDKLARVTAMNAAAEKLTGWHEAEAVDRALDAVLPLRGADGEAQPLPPGALSEPGYADGLRQDALLEARDGNLYRIAVSAALIYLPEGGVQGAILIIRDITAEYELRSALETSERRQRAAVEGGEVGVWEWDASTDDFAHFGIWVDQFSELASSGFILGEDHMRVTHPDDRQLVRAALIAHLKGDSTTYQVEQRLLMRDGNYRRFLVRGNTTEFDAAGRPRKLTGTYTDITELREQQKRLELALEFGREGLFEWLPATDELHVSDNWMEVFGTDTNRLRNLDVEFAALIHPADLAQTRAALVDALKGPLPYETEFRMRRNDGGEMWVLARGVIADRDANGRALRMLGTLVDITDLKLAQDRLQLAVDSVPQGIIEWWPDDDRLQPSPSWLRLTGYRAEEIQTPDQIIEAGMVHADDINGVKKLLLEFSSGLIVSGQIEFRFRFASGEYHWLLGSGQVAEYDADGRSRRVVGTCIDISELKVAEQRLAVVVEATRQGVWEWLPDTDRFIASRSWQRLFGYSADEMPTMVAICEIVLHPDDVATAKAILREMAYAGRDHGEIELRMRNRDGEYLHILARAVVVDRRDDGRAVRVIGTDYDITEVKRAHLRLDLALRASLQGMFEWWPQEDDLIVEPSWHELTGLTSTEVPAKMHPAAKLLVHPDDFDLVWSTLDGVRNGKLDEYTIESRQKHKSGHYVWIMSRGIVVERDESGRALKLIGSNIDISHLKQAEEHMRLAIEATGLGLWEWLPQDNRMDFPGDSWWHLTGYEHGRFSSMEEMIELQHPDDRIMVARTLGGMLAGETDRTELTIRFKNAQGRYISLLTRAYVAERDTEGRPRRIAGTNVDITTLKEIEQQLEASRQLLRTVLDTVPDSIFWKDTNGVYRGGNRQLAVYAGVSSVAGIIGRTDRDLPWRDMAEHMEETDKALFSGAVERVSAERRLRQADGSEWWVQTTKVPLYDGGGQLMGTLGVTHDISDYKLALADVEAQRARLELVIRGTGAGLWEWDVLSGGVHVNERWSQILGFESVEKLGPQTNASLQSRIHPDDVSRLTILLQNLQDGRSDIYECDYRIRHRDGHWVWAHDTGRVTARDNDDKPTHVSGTLIEVSERVERDWHLKAIAEAVTRAHRGDLLNTLVRTARELADATYAFVAAFDDSGQRVTVIAAAPADAGLEGVSYDIETTPCASVVRDDTCIFADGVASQFPVDHMLADMKIQGYAGQRLSDEAGVARGIFVLLSTEPITAIERTRSLLHILAATAANELERERRETALRDSEMRYRRIYEIMPILLCTLDGQANVVDVNETWVQTSGFPLHKCLGQPITQFFAPPSRNHLAAVLEQGRKLVRGEREYLELVARDGKVVKTAFTLFGGGRIAGGDLRILALEDVSMRVHTEEQLRIAATAFETHGAMTVFDRDQRVLRVNQAFTDLTQYTREEATDAPADFLRSDRHDAHFYRERWRDIEEFGRWEGEMWVRRKDGSEFPVWQAITAVHGDGGRVTHYVSNMIDITERVRAKREIERLAFYDSLTGLPNRRYLLDRLGAAVATARRRHTSGALLFIDLDHFKHINDSMGHAVGDQVLVEVGNRLRELIRQEDVVCRMGGDEFIVMLGELGHNEEQCHQHATSVVQKISAELSRPYSISTQEFHMTPTIGIALFPGQSDSPTEVLKEADSAMYQGKAEGRNTFRFYHASMAAAATERLQLEHDLRAALDTQELELFFQPQINVDSGIIGAEALIRWRHPQRGFIPPDKFIPIAEDSNLIHAIGEWVVTRALAVMKAWLNDGLSFVKHVSINVSSRQFRAPDFVDRLEQLRADSGVAAHHVVLELTERTVMDDVEGTIQKMTALRSLGFQFSVDDFGIGYSSLAYLRRLPLDQLKVDRSFVLDVVEDVNAGVIAEVIIAMGRQLGLETIAEGVETEAQREFLVARGCRGFQGYLFCPPVSEVEFRQYCAAGGRRAQA